MSKNKSRPAGKRGSPLPYGATILPQGVNFSIFSRNSTSVELVVEVMSGNHIETLRFPLSPDYNRTGDIWHIELPLQWKHISYGYSIDGKDQVPAGSVYQPSHILIDPYCKSLRPRAWGKDTFYGKRPCCRINGDTFQWHTETPLKRPLNETVIYELHVRGFTANPNSRSSAPGTYLGLQEKIPYLKSLGITAVELMPVAEFDENDNVFHNPETGKRLKNFWGYNSINFFSLKSGYASVPENHIREFKEMVCAFHREGIEVILDIVFNHTGEGGYEGTTSCFRGIDNSIYYILDSETSSYTNFSGCGNTLNCNHPIVREMIRMALRYWVMEMHIDGFRFDLASILGRDTDGTVLADPPMLQMIAEDPVLRDTKIIAEAWDAAGLYQVGSFSTDGRWSEWNGKFRDDVRAFFSGHKGSVTRLATRIAGSSDLYQHGTRGPANSINLITSHDGFTLHDLVSYNTKHNLANGEENRDGDNHNISWNSGIEGNPAPKAVQQLRLTRIKSMTVVLLFSQGVPMITAGDEFGRTQGGNNNAWCQDNETGWIDWSLAQKNRGLLHFFKYCIQLRKNHPIFRRDSFFHPEDNEIIWQSSIPGEVDWSDDCHHLAFLLDGTSCNDDHFFIALNGSRENAASITLPPPPRKQKRGCVAGWRKIIDTARPSPDDCINARKGVLCKHGQKIPISPMATIVWTCFNT